jgi:putative transposase
MAKQLSFKGTSGWGGKRRGAGRKNLSGTINHMKRPKVSLKQPCHITLRLKKGIPSLRNKLLFKEFKAGVKRAKAWGLHVIHFSVQSNHIHLFCESESSDKLARAIRSLAGQFAKEVRKYASKKGYGRKGSVFEGRYHLHVLKTPNETKRALEYVLLNTAKHMDVIEHVDRYSSGNDFKHWRLLLGKRYRSLIKADAEFYSQNPTTELDEILSPARSWLAKTGWVRAQSKSSSKKPKPEWREPA